MKARDARPAFDGTLFFLLIAVFPVVFILFKYLLWETYGVFDFYTFHLAGVLANAGLTEQIYQFNVFESQFVETYGMSAQLPWFYPPVLLPWCQFLAIFPVSVAFLVNGILSIATYYFTIIKVFPDRFREIIKLSALPMIIALGFGHPVVFLLSLMILGYKLAKSNLLGALVLVTLSAAKPHLAGVALFAMFFRDWRQSLAPSMLIFVGFTLGISIIYGAEIWILFLQNLGSASSFVGSGTINQQWISSAYAVSLKFGASNLMAAVIHFAFLLLIVSASLFVFSKDTDTRFWATTGFAVIFTSPYLMYYDVVYLLFPLALVVNKLNLAKARNWTYALFIGEVILVAILNLETAGGLGFFAFLAFTAVLGFANLRYAEP